MSKSKNKCEHKNKKILSSYKGYDNNFLEIECIDCGMHRYETRYTTSTRIDSSRWFTPNKKCNK